MEYLGQMLERNARELPDRTFIIADGVSLTYRDFARQTARLAHVLAARGVGKSDRVGLYLPSNPWMAIGFWACQQLGAVPAPLSAMFRHDELRKVIANTGLSALIMDDGTYPYFSQIESEFGDLPCLVAGDCVTEDRRLETLMAGASDSFDNVPCARDDTAALFFTSGTTGTPKGIAQSQFATCSSLRDMMVSHRSRYGEEVYLCAVPLFTNFGLTVTLNLCLYTGGTIVLHERWDTERVLADIARHRATYFGGTPTMYVYMVNDYDAERHDLSSLRLCTTGGSPVPQSVVQRFEAVTGARVIQVYGSTETLGQCVMEPSAGIRKPGSAGLPVGSSRIAIVGDSGDEVPSGTIGEVVIGGDCVSEGYFGDPDATSAAFTARGWASGDLGYLDADGYLYIVDRKKDVIIAGGHNIYPIEVETLLYQHPAVAMCAVVGIPDESKGEIPVAVIVRAAGRATTEAEFNAFCREHLSAYKVPRQFHFIDAMPVEAAKIRKRDLVTALRDGSLDTYRN
ncbi:MAG: AMP-binding protein [Devosia nanyangense]|uniref:AMP-binding protein n=1 Tax=Devosia nanyangense TaxID=1228055 RepID=A0A933KZQ3_9HYPH|nr:AMP-binding protein [Devosia nanyangense]